jgi:hypothetical protein
MTADERAQQLLIELRRQLMFCSTLTPADFEHVANVIRDAEHAAYNRAAALLEEILEPRIRRTVAEGMHDAAVAIRALAEK